VDRVNGPSRPISFLDTTLRDGEQAPGISLSVEEKVEIARQLVRLGVDVIEAGFPASSSGQLEAVRRIAETDDAPVIGALCRARDDDIDLAWSAIRTAERPRLKVFISTSEIHLSSMLRMSRPEVLDAARRCVARARSYVDDVQFSAQDATRTDPEFLLDVYRAAVDEGATTVNVTDTVGFALPDEFGRLVRTVAECLPRHVAVSTHCHDDLGLAVANTLAGVTNGARQVEVTVNGIGERAGNCSLEELAMILVTREAAVDRRHRLDVGEILATSTLVSRLTGSPVHPNKAVVGANAFAHESGIHQHGVLADRETYEVIDPRSIGRDGSTIVLGRHSGRHGFEHAIRRLGFTLEPDRLRAAFERFKRVADEVPYVTDADLVEIAESELGRRAAG
jgi:2-isopropylmalate synthase